MGVLLTDPKGINGLAAKGDLAQGRLTGGALSLGTLSLGCGVGIGDLHGVAHIQAMLIAELEGAQENDARWHFKTAAGRGRIAW